MLLKTQISLWLVKHLRWSLPALLVLHLLAVSAAVAAPPTPEEARKTLWSVQPIHRPPLPTVDGSKWVGNPVDAFIRSKLDAAKLKPAPPADKVALLRRATYDLTGLPPTPAEVDAFLADPSPHAYETVLDRLLASPHYGEKWARHWLDLVRYGESNSYERDDAKPHVWHYRDYVIRSFNEDKPYDRFVKEQLAGDEMADAASNIDDTLATGFYRLGIWDDEPSDKLQARYDMLDDIVTTVGQVFLGMTVDCARCHNHKIDPIPQTDYYRLLAFFQNITDYRNGGPGDEAPIVAGSAERQAYAERMAERKQRRKQVLVSIKETEDNFRQIISGEKDRGPIAPSEVPGLIRREGKRVLGADTYAHYEQLLKERDSLSRPDASTGMALCVSENGRSAPQTFVCLRGNANAPGEFVRPGFLSVLGGADAVVPDAPSGAKTCGRRTVLANWIASKDNPLFARVMANRLWQYHFGRGIVRSPNNFGIGGDPPTHPQLLDWLASELIDQGWRLKAMHRMIMTSDAYRMSCQADAQALTQDPQNDLFWRFDLRRLTAEEVRDSILAANGTLNLKMYGPSVYPHVPKEVLAGQSRPGNGWSESNAEDSARRSIYVHVKRSLKLPLLESFDAADTDHSCPVRFVTVQPTQALGMINGAFINEEAQKLANRLREEAGAEAASQVKLAWRLTTCRAPTEKELTRSLDLIESLQNQDHVSREKALDYFCLMLLNLNEFVYLD